MNGIAEELRRIAEALEVANRIKAMELLWGPANVLQTDRDYLHLVAGGIKNPSSLHDKTP